MIRLIDLISAVAGSPVVSAIANALGPVPLPVAADRVVEALRQLVA